MLHVFLRTSQNFPSYILLRREGKNTILTLHLRKQEEREKMSQGVMANLLIEWEKRTQFLDSWIRASSFSKNRQGRWLLGGLRGWRSLIALTGKWCPYKRRVMIINIKHIWKMSLSFGSSLITSVQSLSHVWLFATPWTAACQASLSITHSWSLLKLVSIESVMPSNHLILCHPHLLLPSIFPSIRVFSNKSVLHIRWPKYWSFSFSISHSNEYSGLISFRIDWLDLLAAQGTLKIFSNTTQFKI